MKHKPRRYENFAALVIVEWASSDGPSWLLTPFCKRRFDPLPAQDWMEAVVPDLEERGVWVPTMSVDGVRCSLSQVIRETYRDVCDLHKLVRKGCTKPRNMAFQDDHYPVSEIDWFEHTAHRLGRAGLLTVRFTGDLIDVRPSEKFLTRFSKISAIDARRMSEGRSSRITSVHEELIAVSYSSCNPVEQIIQILM
jgi:hypothetical protein